MLNPRRNSGLRADRARLRGRAGVISSATIVMILTAVSCPTPEPPPVDTAPRAEKTPAACFSVEDRSASLPVSRGWRTHPSLLDVDGDGDLDLAATTRKGDDPTVFLYSPDGWSARKLSLGAFPCGVGVKLTDLTSDGIADLIVADHCTGLHLFKGDGKGEFAPHAHLQHPSGEGFNDAAAGDLDGDGRVDLVAVAAFTYGYTVFRGDRVEGAYTPIATNLPTSGWGWDVTIQDVDGDGAPDIVGTLQGLKPVARTRGQREAKVWLQRRGEDWVPAEGLPEEGNFFGIDTADFDQDGLTDIAIGNRDVEGGILMFRGAGSGRWEELTPLGRVRNRTFAGVRTGDIDGDGHMDVVAIEHRTPAVVAWLGRGDGTFHECPDRPGPLPDAYRPGWGLALGDVDGDGVTEVVVGFGSEIGGALRAWSLRPAERP